MKNSQQYINPIGYRRELERDSELGYWIALDRRREKALRQLNKQGGKAWPEQEKAASRQPKPTKNYMAKTSTANSDASEDVTDTPEASQRTQN